jgi:hypothetical protein
MRNWTSVLALALMSACSAGTPPAATVPAATSVAAPTPTAIATPAAQAPAFVDKVWRVTPTSAQQPGTTYTFLSGGALVIDAPGGTPMTGAWRQVDGRLTMVEDGIAYPTDIVELDTVHLVLRSHNPGGAVLIRLVAAPGEPLPHPANR